MDDIQSDLMRHYEQGVKDERTRIVLYLFRIARDLKEFDDDAEALFIEEIIGGILND